MFEIGDKIVYPMHGAGIIEAIEEKEILGVRKPYYVVSIRSMRLMFPTGSNPGIRLVVNAEVLEHLLTNLNQGDSDTWVNPTHRYRSNLKKMKSGDLYEGAQVIRDLTRIGRKKSLAAGDKVMLSTAQQILVSELVLVNGIAEEQAIDLLNFAINN